jgi:hypothetical protein
VLKPQSVASGSKTTPGDEVPRPFPDAWAASGTVAARLREPEPSPAPAPVLTPAASAASLSRRLPRRPSLKLGRRAVSVAAAVAVALAGGVVWWVRPWQPDPAGLALPLEPGTAMVFRVESWSGWATEPGYAGRADTELEGLLTLKAGAVEDGTGAMSATLHPWSLTVNGRPIVRPPTPRAQMRLATNGLVEQGGGLALPTPSAPLLLAATGITPALPDGPVRPGDRWSAARSRARLFGGRASVRAEGWLLRYAEMGTAKVAVVRGTRRISLRGSPLLGRGTIVVNQTAWIEVTTGAVLRSDAVLTVDLRARRAGGAHPIEGTTSLRLRAVP